MNIQMNTEARVLTACFLIAVATLMFDLLTPLGVAGGVPYFLLVLVSLWSDRLKMPYYMAMGGSVLIITGIFLSPPGVEPWKFITNRGIALFTIWATAILVVQRKSISEEKEAALAKIKVLSGMLPICASCKKIRDDKGYWNQMEAYIRDHSEAEFTHGICPDCAKRLYPELHANKDDN